MTSGVGPCLVLVLDKVSLFSAMVYITLSGPQLPGFFCPHFLLCRRNTGITDDRCCAWLCTGARELNTCAPSALAMSHRVRFK